LYFQHVMKLQPCVMCVYERVALLGIMVAGLIGAIAPRNMVIRWVAILIWV
ncbi:disulfide bond formation protein B, partial [Escherichia coli]